MSANRSVRGGDMLTLRSRFQDDTLVNAQASGVYINIYPAGADLTNNSAALVYSGSPVYFDQGIFEYNYNTPEIGPDGLWHDVWYGTLNNQLLSGVFTFFVAASGEINSIGGQLNINNLVELTIPSGIKALDGTSIAAPIQVEFMTTVAPHYSDQRKIRLEIGGYIQNIGDDTLEQAILESSIEADQLTFNKSHINSALYMHARREYVTCRSGLMLLTNLGNAALRGKTLADLRVEYDTQAIRDTMKRMQDCIDRWQRQVMTGGLAVASEQPEFVVKGAFDPDRPAIGRLWNSTDTAAGSGRIPASNTKVRNPFSRRYSGTFVPKRYW